MSVSSSRRNFLKGAAFFGAASVLPQLAPSAEATFRLGPPGPMRLKVGVLSDVHCHPAKKKGWLAPYFRLMDEAKVDAVIVAGDLGCDGTIRQVELMAEEWYSVFPDDRRSDGTPVVKLFVSGNHDDLLRGSEYKSADEVREKSYLMNRERTWERLFHEPWKPIALKTVKGYDFILKHWCAPRCSAQGVAFPGDKSPTAAFVAEHAKRLREGGRPFFYIQHEPLDETVNATWTLYGDKWENAQGANGSRKVFEPFPNAVVITGHTHFSLTDEMSIWQGAFTAVNASCTSGNAFVPPGHENGQADDDFQRNPRLEMPPLAIREVRQGMIMEVYDDRINFHKLDLYFGASLGEDWVVPLFENGATVPPQGTPKYDFKLRSETSPVPEFAAGAKITAVVDKNGHKRHPKYATLPDPAPTEQLQVSFPPALSGVRAYDYEVTVSERTGPVERILAQKRVFSPNGLQGVSRETQPVRCCFGRDYIPLARKLRIVVKPLNVWGKRGKALELITKLPKEPVK